MVFQCLDLFSYDCSPQPEPSRGLQPNQRQKRNHHSQILPEAYISLRYNKKESDHLAFYLFPSDLTPSNQKEHEKPRRLNEIKIHKPKTMWRFNSFLHNQNLPQAYACMRAKGLAHNHLAFFLWFSNFIFTARKGQNLTPPSDQKEHEKTWYLNEISFKKNHSLLTFFVEADPGSQRIQFKARPVHWLTKGGLDAGLTRPPFAHQYISILPPRDHARVGGHRR